MVNREEKKRRRFVWFTAAGSLLGLLLIQWITFLVIPAQSEKMEKLIEIPQGANLRSVAQLLDSEGIIKNPTYFIVAGKLIGVERAIKPGEYALGAHMGPLDILNVLKKGHVYQYVVVIPEGYAVRQVARLLEEKNLVDAEAFIGLAGDPELIRSYGIESQSLEGYLFPSTYYVASKTSAGEIIRMMVRTFNQVYTPEFEERARELNLTRHQVVTLASMIEKETSVAEERTLISAVFHNRLRRRMPLQSDPTVIYALPEFDGNLKRIHLRIDSPYNTYRWPGLPPGPIANPGADSLYAALYPASVSYLFFVSKNNGTHYFSNSLEEHNRAVDKYQRNRSRAARD